MSAKSDDYAIMAALMASSTKTEAARLSGVSVKTIYNRLNDPEFMARYERERQWRAERLSDIMDSAAVSALTRLQSILDVETSGALALWGGVSTADQIKAAGIVLGAVSRK